MQLPQTHRRSFIFSIFLLSVLGGALCESTAQAMLPVRIERTIRDSRAAGVRVQLLRETDEPIAGAMVQVGLEANSKFTANIARTNANGEAFLSVPDTMLDSNLPITIAAAGFARATFFTTIYTDRIAEHSFLVRLRRNPELDDMPLATGEFTAWPTGVDGTRAELGMFLPTFSAETLLSFDSGTMVSSFVDQMTVAGRTNDVPGNLVIPTQSKRYGFIPITLSKPEFHMPMLNTESGRFAAIAGSASINEIVDLARGNDYLGMVNLIDFTHINWTPWQMIDPSRSMRISLEEENASRKLKTRVDNTPAGMDFLAIGLLDPERDFQSFIPVDIKTMDAKLNGSKRHTLRLNFPRNFSGNKNAYVFNAAIDKSQFSTQPMGPSHFSAALTEAVWEDGRFEARESEFLPILRLGNVTENYFHYSFTPARAPEKGTSDLQEEFILFQLYSLARERNSQTNLRVPVWTAILPSGTRELQLPRVNGENDLPLPDLGLPQRFYWEVVAIRRKMPHNEEEEWDSLVTLENLRQVSHARKELGINL